MTNAAAELRRQYRAARHLERVDDLRARLEERTARARATLAAALANDERTTVPGYAVWRDPAGALHVQPVDPIDADQLALWAEIAREEHDQ